MYYIETETHSNLYHCNTSPITLTHTIAEECQIFTIFAAFYCSEHSYEHYTIDSLLDIGKHEQKTVSVPELHLGKVGIHVYQEMYMTYIQ